MIVNLLIILKIILKLQIVIIEENYKDRILQNRLNIESSTMAPIFRVARHGFGLLLKIKAGKKYRMLIRTPNCSSKNLPYGSSNRYQNEHR